MAVWEARHGERDNSGFSRVNTAPIRHTPLTIPNLGTFADGVAPVTAWNGQVFIGNEQGRLFAFEADGRSLWHRDLGRGFVIKTSRWWERRRKVISRSTFSAPKHFATIASLRR